MIRRFGIWGLVVAVVVLAVVGLYGWRRARGQTPLTITGPNILQNNDFSVAAKDNPSLPAGWTQAQGATGVQYSDWTFDGNGRSVQIQGTNNFLKSPYIAARPGAEYRVAFRAFGYQAVNKVRVLFYWRDADGLDRAIEPQAWQPVPAQNWNTVSAAARAPEYATQVAISIRPASDSVIFVDDLSMGQLGVRINPWPQGKRAALAFSFDYETAMGGLVHSRSVDDPNADTNPSLRAQRMRAGAAQALKLLTPFGIRATFYSNGYNFLTGNTERRQFMNNPVYAWANPANGWKSNIWAAQPWFSFDPYKTEAEAPEWYFGSQIALLQQAQQDIQSHTFAHFAGTYVTPDDWRADFTAWQQVAKERGVTPATSLAFPWSSSAGMPLASWQVLAQQGIRSVTRTTWNPGQRRSWLADREQYALRRVPGAPDITVIADTGDSLTPKTRDKVLQQMQTALLNEGAIDVWAHTEELTSPDQIAAWQAAIDPARRDFWIAPVPEIVQYAQDIRQVTVDVQSEQPNYTFTIRNTSPRDLKGVTLTLPFTPRASTLDGQPAPAQGDQLLIDLPRGATRTIVLTGSAGATSDVQPEAVWIA